MRQQMAVECRNPSVPDSDSTDERFQATAKPLILGIGGTLRNDSTSERALRVALDAAEQLGARVHTLTGAALDLPNYDPGNPRVTEKRASLLIDLCRSCDGLIISSPGYHGLMSGMIKNALDYVEELRNDERVYLDGLPVGCIASSCGWQAATTTITALRSTVHALRGWPTPLAVAINSTETVFDAGGACRDDRVGSRLRTLAGQVVAFAQRAAPTPAADGCTARR